MNDNLNIPEADIQEYVKNAGTVIPKNPSQPLPKEVIESIVHGSPIILVDAIADKTN